MAENGYAAWSVLLTNPTVSYTPWVSNASLALSKKFSDNQKGVKSMVRGDFVLFRPPKNSHIRLGFDYSVSEWGPELRADTEVKSRAHFFPYKIGGADNHTASPKEYTLQGIMKELGHDFIDIWKVRN